MQRAGREAVKDAALRQLHFLGLHQTGRFQQQRSGRAVLRPRIMKVHMADGLRRWRAQDRLDVHAVPLCRGIGAPGRGIKHGITAKAL